MMKISNAFSHHGNKPWHEGTRKKEPEYWMQKVAATHKEGSTHRMLGVPQSMKIPLTLLEVVRHTPIGEVARNPTQVGHPRIKVTKLLKQRCVAALNMKRVTKRRFG